MDDIDMLKRQRKIIRTALSRIVTYCANENATLAHVSVRAERADQLLKEYENIQNKIDESVDEQNERAEEQYRIEIEEKYYSIKAKYNLLKGNVFEGQQQHQPAVADSSEITTAVQALIQHQGSMSLLIERFANNVQIENASTPVENATRVVSELRLPRVNLPDFEGNILDWVRFKELFEAFVHNRTNLSNIEKLEYLNTKLKGDALSIIKHLKPTANNYEVAWELLNRKYNNNDRIKSAYMELLFDRPVIKSAGLNEIKEFYNKLNEGYNALKSIDNTVEQWSSALLFNVEKKLDCNTASLWFREKQPGETSTFAKFLEFLEKRVFELESMQSKEQNRTSPKDHNKRPQMRTYIASKQVCPICSSDHPPYQCEKFLKMNVDQRRDIVRNSNLCFNCLRRNHNANQCKSTTCKKCDKKHNTLLHISPVTRDSQQTTTIIRQGNLAQSNTTTNEVKNQENYVSTNTSQQVHQTHVILPTAIITVSSKNNEKYKCRALLDSGSQGTLISESCVQRLNLKRKYDKTIIFGLGNHNGNYSRGKVDLKIIGNRQVTTIETEALCLKTLTKTIPAINIHNTKLDYFRNLKLADPRFHESAEIDIILGADVYMQCCLNETIVHPSGSPSAMNTIFDWVIMGTINSEGNNKIFSNYVSVDIDQCLQRFWEIEEVPHQQQKYTPDEEAAETYYVRTTQRQNDGRYEVRLPFKNEIPNIAKTRVAPVKQLSLPRLELCGAHLLVKLMSKIRNSIGSDNIIMHGWTDSTIVLAWLSDHPRRWKTFVANRTSEIINIMPAQQWHHIRSQSNPADLATRGITTRELIDNQLWWHGPDELHQKIQNSHANRKLFNCDLEERHKIAAHTTSIEECSYIERYSCFIRLMRVTAWILRFMNNSKNKYQRRKGFINTEELRNAHNTIIKLSQMSSYYAEIKTLLSNKSLSDKHPLSSYTPFIDEAGILRVGGRLSKASITYEQKHPILINKHQYLAKLIIKHYHISHCHAGNRLLHYLVQLKYCIPACSSIIKSTIYKCTICMRQRAAPYQQRMGDLPECRIVPAPTFSKVGVDFAGPLQVRSWKGRGSKTYKVWISIFVCLVTKAIHIELVSELSTEAFIATFRRFVSRRGKPLHVYSDNGTNFVGANNQLKQLYEFLQNNNNQDHIQNYFTNQQINWHFIPPAGPNFGGLWEAGVKAIKYHLKRVLQEAHPTFEELTTTLCQIEACLNSRPLCLKFENDVDALTPAHFLLLRPINSLPEENKLEVKENRLTRWQYVQRLVHNFWKKWSNEYLNQLQQRYKWKHTSQNIAINDVVIIKEEQTAPTHWIMGKVTAIHPGTDGLIRVVTLKTKNGHIKRPINKICPLFH